MLWVKNGRYWLNLRQIVAVEERSRDRMANHGVVSEPICFVHLSHPLMTHGTPPAWVLTLDGEDRRALIARLELLAVEQDVGGAAAA